MPYKDSIAKIANDRARYQRNGVQMRAAAQRHYHLNAERISKDRKLRRTPEARARDTAAMKRYHASLRAEMIRSYGGRCACCGEAEALFLELDHVNGRGSEERRSLGRGSGQTYRRLKRQGWPKDGYQLLCANCNQGRARNGGVCPHGR